MPSKSKPNALNSNIEANSLSEPPVAEPLATERDPGSRVGRKKNRNAATKRQESRDEALEAEIARDTSPSTREHSTLDRIPRSFPPPRPAANEDALEGLNTTEKVSDEHTPPQDAFVPSSSYGRSPPSELIPGLSYAPSPPTQYSYIGKGGFNARSPPTSPPQAKARPVSYGGRPTSNYGYPRLSTSPYGQPVQAYGSPPALPHLPQQHIYNAQDIGLRGGARPLSAGAQPPSLLKFAKFPGSQLSTADALFVGSESHLDVLSYGSETFSHVASLSRLPGSVHDAVFLPWNSGVDPLRELRPLVALALHDATSLELGAEDDPIIDHSPAGPMPMLLVIVFSLRTQEPVAELLRAPMSEHQQFAPNVPEQNTSKDRLSLHASGDHLLISSVTSGEVFVFSIRQDGSAPTFECLTKLWTIKQPRMQRRDSSHGRPGEVDMSPADLNRGEHTESRPVLSLNGRWLAYSPATAANSIGASLGNTIVAANTFTITSRSPPSRPTVSCEVESPDVDTLLGKVARGAAQTIVKGSKWLGEMGMQAWRNWNAESLANPQPPPSAHRSPVYSPVYSPNLAPSSFPPTHGDFADASSEPELVSIVDLKVLKTGDSKKTSEPISLLATFQPPAGCSFISFAPNGLSLLTASRKGDVQYIWDLFQIRHLRSTIVQHETETGNFSARVRQLAKYERFSPSLIVDVQWEAPLGHRFASLTQNRTIHMFDVPSSALRWPPARKAKKQPRPVTAPAEKIDSAQAPTSPISLLASARSLATRTQPMIANLRGRTPSISTGVSGIGASGIGLASATSMRGGKVVAAGFSKSLGAATDTVAHIRHAGQSKLHLKVEAAAGRLLWRKLESRTVLCILSLSGVQNYYVRKTNPRERQLETVSVFDARKAVAHKLPSALGSSLEHLSIQDDAALEINEQSKRGFWRPEPVRLTASGATTAPLSYAEIETNAPYQPFHSDHRVSMSVYSDPSKMGESQLPTVSVLFQPQSRQTKPSEPDRWIFGGDIPTTRLQIPPSPQRSGHDPQESVVYRETTVAPVEGGHEDAEQIVSTTRRRKVKRQPDDPGNAQGLAEQADFFEDDLEVLDSSVDRV